MSQTETNAKVDTPNEKSITYNQIENAIKEFENDFEKKNGKYPGTKPFEMSFPYDSDYIINQPNYNVGENSEGLFFFSKRDFALKTQDGVKYVNNHMNHLYNKCLHCISEVFKKKGKKLYNAVFNLVEDTHDTSNYKFTFSITGTIYPVVTSPSSIIDTNAAAEAAKAAEDEVAAEAAEAKKSEAESEIQKIDEEIQKIDEEIAKKSDVDEIDILNNTKKDLITDKKNAEEKLREANIELVKISENKEKNDLNIGGSKKMYKNKSKRKNSPHNKSLRK